MSENLKEADERIDSEMQRGKTAVEDGKNRLDVLEEKMDICATCYREKELEHLSFVARLINWQLDMVLRQFNRAQDRWGKEESEK